MQSLLHLFTSKTDHILNVKATKSCFYFEDDIQILLCLPLADLTRPTRVYSVNSPSFNDRGSRRGWNISYPGIFKVRTVRWHLVFLSDSLHIFRCSLLWLNSFNGTDTDLVILESTWNNSQWNLDKNNTMNHTLFNQGFLENNRKYIYKKKKTYFSKQHSSRWTSVQLRWPRLLYKRHNDCFKIWNSRVTFWRVPFQNHTHPLNTTAAITRS